MHWGGTHRFDMFSCHAGQGDEGERPGEAGIGGVWPLSAHGDVLLPEEGMKWPAVAWTETPGPAHVGPPRPTRVAVSNLAGLRPGLLRTCLQERTRQGPPDCLQDDAYSSRQVETS